jgi:hypothetical protein
MAFAAFASVISHAMIAPSGWQKFRDHTPAQVTVRPLASLQLQVPRAEPMKAQPMAGELTGGHTHAQVGLFAHAAGSGVQERVVGPPPGTPGKKL